MIIFENIIVIGVYHIQALIIYMEARYKLESETFTTTLVLTLHDFEQNSINKHELVINGKYFDVKKSYRQKNKVIVKGYWDVKESALMKQLESRLMKELVKKLIKLFPKLFAPTVLLKLIGFIICNFEDKREKLTAFVSCISFECVLWQIKPPIFSNHLTQYQIY